MGTIIHETAPSSLLITDLTQIEKRTLFNFMAGCNSKQHMDINLYPEGTKSLMRETLREHPVCLWGLRGSTSKLLWRLGKISCMGRAGVGQANGGWWEERIKVSYRQRTQQEQSVGCVLEWQAEARWGAGHMVRWRGQIKEDMWTLPMGHLKGFKQTGMEVDESEGCWSGDMYARTEVPRHSAKR